MKLHSMTLINFRNHKNFRCEPEGDSVSIFGQNGSGKTNILEAIHMLSTTKSLRTNYDREVISHDEKMARIDAVIENADGKADLEFIIVASDKYENASKKLVKINKVGRSIQKFAGILTSVLFSPTEIEIFASPPSQRRKYLDSIFFQIDSKYKRAHTQYTKIMRQRNKLLEQIREHNRGYRQIEFWNEKLIETGAQIQEKRAEFFSFLTEELPTRAGSLNGKDFEYAAVYKKNKVSGERLAEYRDREIASRSTLVGPHRDDFCIKLGGYDVGQFGSRGQQRGTLLALKLCELDFITRKNGERPLLLLDDIFSEFDEKHRDAVMQSISAQQTIVTSADDHGQIKHLVDGMKLIRL